MEQEQKRKRLSLRQHKYKLNRLKGMNQLNAAIAAGYSPTTARHKSKSIEAVVKSSMYDLLERTGLTDKVLAEHIKAGTEATRSFVTIEGVVESPDWSARHKYATTALQLKRHLSEAESSNLMVDNSVKILIVNKGVDGTIIRDREGRQDSERVNLVSEAVTRFEQSS